MLWSKSASSLLFALALRLSTAPIKAEEPVYDAVADAVQLVPVKPK